MCSACRRTPQPRAQPRSEHPGFSLAPPTGLRPSEAWRIPAERKKRVSGTPYAARGQFLNNPDDWLNSQVGGFLLHRRSMGMEGLNLPRWPLLLHLWWGRGAFTPLSNTAKHTEIHRLSTKWRSRAVDHKPNHAYAHHVPNRRRRATDPPCVTPKGSAAILAAGTTLPRRPAAFFLLPSGAIDFRYRQRSKR